MEKRFGEALKRLAGQDKKILVAVSGGLDSVVLLDLLCRTGHPLAVAHANFQLRGEESERDEAFVRASATSLGLKVYVKRFETNNYAIDNQLSIQMAARELRYTWFKELLAVLHLDFVVTAHHLNDSFETTMINLLRGSGLAGLAGIPPRNENVIRPMLIFTREEIAHYAQENNLSWCEDSSNASDDYQRNFIRHKIVPLLKGLNPSLEATHQQTIDRLGAAAELAVLGVSMLRDKGVIIVNGNTVIRKDLFAGFDHPAAILWEMIREFGFNLSQCASILRAATGQSGKIFHAATYELVVDRDTFIVSEVKENHSEVKILEDQQSQILGTLKIEIEAADRREESANVFQATLDRAKLTFPLVWRMWQEGDVFYPLGLGHRKKISDLLIDEKVSRAEKSGVTVITSAGEIIWVVGQRIDDRYKVTDTTSSCVVFTVTKQ